MSNSSYVLDMDSDTNLYSTLVRVHQTRTYLNFKLSLMVECSYLFQSNSMSCEEDLSREPYFPEVLLE